MAVSVVKCQGYNFQQLAGNAETRTAELWCLLFPENSLAIFCFSQLRAPGTAKRDASGFAGLWGSVSCMVCILFHIVLRAGLIPRCAEVG